MKVMLITPISKRSPECWMPLGLCSLAAVLLEQSHQVELFDRTRVFFDWDIEQTDQQMVSAIAQFQPDMIGFSTYTPVINDTIRAVARARTVSDAFIVLGGHHVTALPELTLQRIPQADAVLVGEGEESICMLANNLPKEEIPGLYWRASSDEHDFSASAEPIIQKGTVQRRPIDLSRLPLPAYHLLDMDFYTKRNISTIRPYYLRVGSVIAARGCTNRCTFCTESLTFSGGIRRYTPAHVIEAIRLLIETYGCDGITFYDNSFLADPGFVSEIILRIQAAGLHKKALFCIQSRADQITDEVALLLRRANFRKIEIGFESVDPSVLASMRKNMTVLEAESALRICRRHGLSVQANLIMGMEGDTIDALNSTLSWVRRQPIDNVKWFLLQLLPGSLLYKQKGAAAIERNIWSKAFLDRFFATDHLSGMADGEAMNWYKTVLSSQLKWVHRKSTVRRNRLNRYVQYFLTRLYEKGKARWGQKPTEKRLSDS